nr:MAG TPA: hypothetical protein [Caudoviricetes sp.]
MIPTPSSPIFTIPFFLKNKNYLNGFKVALFF